MKSFFGIFCSCLLWTLCCCTAPRSVSKANEPEPITPTEMSYDKALAERDPFATRPSVHIAYDLLQKLTAEMPKNQNYLFSPSGIISGKSEESQIINLSIGLRNDRVNANDSSMITLLGYEVCAPCMMQQVASFRVLSPRPLTVTLIKSNDSDIPVQTLLTAQTFKYIKSKLKCEKASITFPKLHINESTLLSNETLNQLGQGSKEGHIKQTISLSFFEDETKPTEKIVLINQYKETDSAGNRIAIYPYMDYVFNVPFGIQITDSQSGELIVLGIINHL